MYSSSIPDIVSYTRKLSNRVLPNYGEYQISFVKRIDTDGMKNVKLWAGEVDKASINFNGNFMKMVKLHQICII